jgi:hypothetical protein
MRTTVLTILSVVVYFNGFGWAVGAVVPLFYAFKRGELPTAAGIRLLGGPFEALGMDALIAAGLVFVAVSALRILAAYWLWNARLDGAVLELILLGLSAIFWYGFELPFGPLGGIAEVVLLVLVWGTLR